MQVGPVDIFGFLHVPRAPLPRDFFFSKEKEDGVTHGGLSKGGRGKSQKGDKFQFCPSENFLRLCFPYRSRMEVSWPQLLMIKDRVSVHMQQEQSKRRIGESCRAKLIHASCKGGKGESLSLFSRCPTVFIGACILYSLDPIRSQPLYTPSSLHPLNS